MVMLWTHRQPRVAVNAALYTFVWPWGSYGLGVAVLVLAALGFVRPALAGAAHPCASADRVRPVRGLPSAVPRDRHGPLCAAARRAGCVSRDGTRRPVPDACGLAVTAISLVVASLVVTLPAGSRAYARDGSPAFRAFEAITAARHRGSGSGSPATVIGMHAVMRRVEEWEREHHTARVLSVAAHGREWLALVEHWRNEPDAPVRFVADPRRTDLVLLDPQTRDAATRPNAGRFPRCRSWREPGPARRTCYTMRPPGWMLDRGWALTAEVGGVTAREAWDRTSSRAWPGCGPEPSRPR